jgi:hypothetical protein
MRLRACLKTNAKKANLPIEGCFELLHIEHSMSHRWRWLIRILMPLEAISA